MYPKGTSEVVGNTLASNLGSFTAALNACASNSDCVGLSYDATTSWRAFAGEVRNDVVAKYRIVGQAIDSWRPLPAPVSAPAPSGH